jgi:hypothetical protein
MPENKRDKRQEETQNENRFGALPEVNLIASGGFYESAARSI